MTTGVVLVTGAAGLLGNAVRVLLETTGRQVLAIDRVPTTEEGRSIVQCDLTDVHRLHEVVKGKHLSGIVHCGALSGPMVARDNPPLMIAVNIVGTANVLELARIHSAARFVFCSSTSAYGTTSADLVPEDVPLRPSSLYGASKATGEQLVAAYRRQYGLDGVSLRLSWVFGPRRTTDCIVRDMIADALAGRPTRIPFGKDFNRQFIYIDDAARALVEALDRPNLPRDTYTVTGGSCLTFSQIADVVRAVLPEADISVADGDDPVDDRQSQFDISAARRDLGYLPKFSFAEGVADYAEWLKKRSSTSGGQHV
ncbi:NAD-dependent epimerase/dehydratase family protein [Neoaquamicrobium sediminum]|uniref:NAD-dependent epimerase/dehydratase family protein n=1 Tax=Neoaquamicrobium sediminum TaxID=1849104 RepID=UPI0015665645|nr:NAD(P)-dependent oxidoreductase [Mesorhizobium sediminum]NRC57222.1 NAD(P)-dependent oxidoreductase [Mesorhizobium sediminum]